MFRIPQKQLIVNSASQLRILKYDGSATYIDIASPLLASDGFYLEGFLQPLLFGSLAPVVSTTLITAVAGSTGTKSISTFTCNAIVGNAAGENFVLTYNSLKLSPVDYQNQPLKKHYQLSATLANNATAIQAATAIVNAINADGVAAPVTAANGGTAVVTLTAKEAGVDILLTPTPAVAGGLMTGVYAVTTPPTVDINTYEELKNVNWVKGDALGSFDFDRHAEIFPVAGQTYKSYRFIIKSTPLMSTNLLVPGEKAAVNSIQTEIKLWIANGLTHQTTMDLVVADANTAA